MCTAKSHLCIPGVLFYSSRATITVSCGLLGHYLAVGRGQTWEDRYSLPAWMPGQAESHSTVSVLPAQPHLSCSCAVHLSPAFDQEVALPPCHHFLCLCSEKPCAGTSHTGRRMHWMSPQEADRTRAPAPAPAITSLCL